MTSMLMETLERVVLFCDYMYMQPSHQEAGVNTNAVIDAHFESQSLVQAAWYRTHLDLAFAKELIFATCTIVFIKQVR